MNRLFAAIVVSAAASGFTHYGPVGPAYAGVPLPTIAQAGVQTVAPVLKRITPAIISIAIKGQITDGARKREIRSTGSGVVFDAGQGLIITKITSSTVRTRSRSPWPTAATCRPSASAATPTPTSP